MVSIAIYFLRYFSVFLFVLLMFSLQTVDVHAENSDNKERPKIGLALSGGGARGAAHIGVLKVLEQYQIPIDYIAGTSMGAVVGGLYATGMRADEIEHELTMVDWKNVFNDKPPRPKRTQRRKSDDKLYLTTASLGVSKGKVMLPSAAIQGQRFDLILRALTLPVSYITNFDDLAIPFRAVTTNIETGQEAVLAQGDLALAIRASMAIPLAFSPVEWDGLLLVDGGSTNNLPISVVRDMGADIIIAVDISTPLMPKEKLSQPLAMLTQLSGLLTRRNVETQLSTLTADDILIEPQLGDIATLGFERIQEAVEYGVIAGQDSFARFEPLSLADNAYKKHISNHDYANQEQRKLDFIRFENDSKLDEEMLRQHFGMTAGDTFNINDIERGIERIYSLDVFETVGYSMLADQEQTGIVIKAKQKSWGVEKLQFGLKLSSDFSSDSSFNLGAAYTILPLNSLNGEWRSGVQVGNEPALFTEVYQPLDAAARYFASAGLGWGKKEFRLFNTNTIGEVEENYDVEQIGLTVSVGRNLADWGDIRIGLQRVTGDVDAKQTHLYDNYNFNDGAIFAELRIDTLDNINFTQSGYFGSLKWLSAKEAIGADDDYDQLELRLSTAQSWGDHTLIPSVRVGATVKGNAPIHQRFRLGGFMTLSGIDENQLTGQHVALFSLAYQYQLYKSAFLPVYAGTALQLGNTWEDRDDIKTGNLLSSGSLFIGTDTPLGPLYLGYGLTEDGDDSAYLFLGTPFF